MTNLQQIIQEFKDFHSGNPWYGKNYHEIIDDITPAEALAVPGNGQSIARLLCHMVKWRKSLTIRLAGNSSFRASDTDPDNWPPLNTITEEVWETTKKEFDELQETIISHLESKDDRFLEEEWLPGKNYRYLTIGIVQHDIYHLGQISMLKQLQRTAKQ